MPGISSPRIAVLAATALLVTLLAGCDDWPLYAHLPDPYEEPPPVQEVDATEDATLGDEDVQDLGGMAAPTHITVNGEAESCGFDPEDERYEWPEHPVDEDGDGVADGTRAVTGWFSGDVDLYGFQANGDLWLSASLEWDNAPPGDVNSPYQPTDPEGAWLTESDLDFLILTVAGDLVTGIRSDVGFSADHPQRTAGLIAVPDGGSLAVAVACHHEVGSTYTLTIDLVRP